MPWLEITLTIIALLIAFLTGLSSSPIYSKKEKTNSKDKEK